jgi:hypothetical protein
VFEGGGYVKLCFSGGWLFSKTKTKGPPFGFSKILDGGSYF